MSNVVYILKSLKNDSYYVGSTNDLNRRINQHLDGKSKYTREILPVTLVFKQEFETLALARRVEHWIKKQKDRDFLIRVINEGKITKHF